MIRSRSTPCPSLSRVLPEHFALTPAPPSPPAGKVLSKPNRHCRAFKGQKEKKEKKKSRHCPSMTPLPFSGSARLLSLHQGHEDTSWGANGRFRRWNLPLAPCPRAKPLRSLIYSSVIARPERAGLSPPLNPFRWLSHANNERADGGTKGHSARLTLPLRAQRHGQENSPIF